MTSWYDLWRIDVAFDLDWETDNDDDDGMNDFPYVVYLLTHLLLEFNA